MNGATTMYFKESICNCHYLEVRWLFVGFEKMPPDSTASDFLEQRLCAQMRLSTLLCSGQAGYRHYEL